MELIDHPFRAESPGGIERPYLPLILTNPETSQSARTWGLIDTGADETGVPAGFADMLGHNLTLGEPKEVSGVNGRSITYRHSTIIEVPGFINDRVVVDYSEGLHTTLLGVKSFLGRFVLTINYPAKTFSIRF